MTCEECQDVILTDYLDKNISSSELESLNAHLHHCDACRKFAAEVQVNILEPLEQLPAEDVPGEIWDRIRIFPEFDK